MSTDNQEMMLIAGRLRVIYTDGTTGRRYYLVDGQRRYL